MIKNSSITIVPYQVQKHEQLVNIWLRAVQQSHLFLTQEDIAFYHHIIREQALTAVELWMALSEAEQPVGFIGLEGPHVSMLFVDPTWHGYRIGSRLLAHAIQLKGSLTVDVNEQNQKAVGFYQHYGFEQVGRSELDTSGRPFPLLHFQLNVIQKNNQNIR